ncbi:hypothetical protein [Flavicella marina]|uniref:hypothetical protein n=1 Tax=Flavicella marina TaxID=1475951 RepID=UPI0012657402|nr:hypothetical protein [Flavicella marina]
MKYTKQITITGLVLFSLYLLQELFQLKFEALETLQQRENYKRWSGLALGLIILAQWLLTFSRIIPKFRKNSGTINEIHKWIGVLSPIVLYIHSTQIGYGYLALFSYLFLANVLLGTVNLDVIKSSKDWIFKGWMITHVSISMCITLLLILHVGVVFYYK